MERKNKLRKLRKLTIMIDEETYNKLKHDAEKNLCSISLIVRDALRKYYQKRRVKWLN